MWSTSCLLAFKLVFLSSTPLPASVTLLNFAVNKIKMVLLSGKSYYRKFERFTVNLTGFYLLYYSNKFMQCICVYFNSLYFDKTIIISFEKKIPFYFFCSFHSNKMNLAISITHLKSSKVHTTCLPIHSGHLINCVQTCCKSITKITYILRFGVKNLEGLALWRSIAD